MGAEPWIDYKRIAFPLLPGEGASNNSSHGAGASCNSVQQIIREEIAAMREQR
jgi:hypothetical protein